VTAARATPRATPLETITFKDVTFMGNVARRARPRPRSSIQAPAAISESKRESYIIDQIQQYNMKNQKSKLATVQPEVKEERMNSVEKMPTSGSASKPEQ